MITDIGVIRKDMKHKAHTLIMDRFGCGEDERIGVCVTVQDQEFNVWFSDEHIEIERLGFCVPSFVLEEVIKIV